jgi:hypothetical protein
MTMPMSREVLGSSAPRKICGGCGASYDARSWEALESCGAIAGDDVKAVVTGWPDTAVVDLRRCGRCQMVLARRRLI